MYTYASVPETKVMCLPLSLLYSFIFLKQDLSPNLELTDGWRVSSRDPFVSAPPLVFNSEIKATLWLFTWMLEGLLCTGSLFCSPRGLC